MNEAHTSASGLLTESECVLLTVHQSTRGTNKPKTKSGNTRNKQTPENKQVGCLQQASGRTQKPPAGFQ
jgi:hypothetical protein